MPSAARPLLSAAALAGVLFLVVQGIGMVVHAGADARSVHFTPYSGQTAFRLNVTLGGRSLSDAQIRERYGLPFRGHIALTPEALQAIIIQREGRAGSGDSFVRMHVSRQSGPEEIWLWPQH